MYIQAVGNDLLSQPVSVLSVSLKQQPVKIYYMISHVVTIGLLHMNFCWSFSDCYH